MFTKLKCDLCDAGYVGFTRCHLHQRVEERKSSSSSIGKHFRDKHSLAPKDLTKNFSVLMKCIMYLLTEWEGRTEKIFGSRSVRSDREPNIFPSGPTLLSQ